MFRSARCIAASRAAFSLCSESAHARKSATKRYSRTSAANVASGGPGFSGTIRVVHGSRVAARLAAMQRAERNIERQLDELRRQFHRRRQNAIDEEMFDVIAGYEVLVPARGTKSPLATDA